MTGFTKENGTYKIAPVSEEVMYNFAISKLYYRYSPMIVIFGEEEAAKIINLELAMSGVDKELDRLRNKAGIKLE